MKGIIDDLKYGITDVVLSHYFSHRWGLNPLGKTEIKRNFTLIWLYWSGSTSCDKNEVACNAVWRCMKCVFGVIGLRVWGVLKQIRIFVRFRPLHINQNTECKNFRFAPPAAVILKPKIEFRRVDWRSELAQFARKLILNKIWSDYVRALCDKTWGEKSPRSY